MPDFVLAAAAGGRPSEELFDLTDLAADVAGDALLASEVYLASALAIGETGFLERVYLDGLAEHLGLNGDLKRRLEADALRNQPA